MVKNHRKSKTEAAALENKKLDGLTSQKKNEHKELIKTLLNFSSQIVMNPKLDWEIHQEIDKLLQKIQEIEPVMDTSKKREDYFINLITWIKENNGHTDNIVINNFEKMGYGLEATKDLTEGELICSIPRKLMMTVENVKRSPLNYLFTNDPILQNMGNVALALFLILETLKGPKSFWYPYISSLPATYSTVLYFTIEDFLELKSSPTFEPAIKQCRNIARQYAYFSKVFHMSNDEASVILRDSFTYQLYRWAVSTVMTRQNFIPSTATEAPINGLIPLWDMCNHANGYLSTQYTADRSECMACRSFRKEEQILIFYGKRSNADFLIHNGFVYEDNEHDSFRLRLGISKGDKLHDMKAELLRKFDFAEAGDFFIYSGEEPIREELLAFLRIFSMEKEHLEQWKKSDRLRDLMRKDCALDSKIESKVWNFLFNRISLLLSTYKEVEGHETDASDCRLLIRTQNALEKKFLKSVLDYVQQKIKIQSENLN